MPNAATRSSFWAAGQPTSRCAPELAQGAWLRRGPRRLSRAQSCFPAKENPSGVGLGHRRPQQSSRAQGAKGRRAPLCPLESRGPGAKIACVAFLSRGALGLLLAARGDFPFAQCSLQNLVLGRRFNRPRAVRPSWLREHGCGVGPEGLRAPNPASPPRRTRWEWVSGTGDPQQSSRAQGARGSPATLCPLESRGPGAKTACVAFLSRGALGLLWQPEETFPLQNAAARRSFWAVGATGPWC